MPKLPTLEEFTQDFHHLKDQTITLTFTTLEWWIIMSQVQLALRHPKNTGESARTARRLTHTIQTRVTSTAALRATAEAGWDPNQDQQPITPNYDFTGMTDPELVRLQSETRKSPYPEDKEFLDAILKELGERQAHMVTPHSCRPREPVTNPLREKP